MRAFLESHRGTLIAIAALILAFLLGRFATPAKVVETVKVQTVEKQVVVTQEKVRVERVEVQARVKETHKTTVLTRKPDGSVTVTRTEDTASEATKATGTVATREQQTTAQTERHQDVETAKRVTTLPSWRVTALGGANVHLQPVYGAVVEHRLVGPVSVGAWALSSGVGGIALSVEF